MFEALGRVIYRRRRWVVALTLAFVAFAGVWGTGVFGAMTGGGFEDPDSDSSRASEVAARELGRDSSDVVVLYRSADLTVDDPGYRSSVDGSLRALPDGLVDRTTTFWSSGSPALVSTDRQSTFAVLQLTDGEDEEAIAQIRDDLSAPGLETQIGGNAVINTDINDRVSSDIARAESISLPILTVLLVIIFGSFAAASLPLAIGITAILGAFTALRGFSMFTDVSIFAVNIVTIIGLGLAIDYGLFMVSRFREEIRRQPDVETALARTMATAGRTVAVSGITVAISLAGLLIFPQVFLRSMGFGGMSAVLVAMLAALTLLPALLAMLGPKVDALSVRPWLRRVFRRPVGAPPTEDSGVWFRIAHGVMRRPVLVTLVTVAVLVGLALPFLRVEFGGIDERALPAGTESRVVAETIRTYFPADPSGPIEAVVTLPDAVDSPAGGAALQSYVDAVADVPGVDGATVTGAAGETARVAIAYAGDPMAEEARALVNAVRDVPAPPGGEVLVGGQSAVLTDLLESLGALLPWMALIVVSTTFVLLFLAFGSIVLPVKALVMNVLSIGASFGALVWIFQDGHLSGFLDFTPTGFVEATQPILVLAIIFGLSMDYEVFLMSRIREQYDLTGDNTTAVATGLQRTGGIITSAALLLLVVIAAFSLSGITFIKMIGVAMLIAVVVDATIVRILLVPATMRLLGNANWYAPGPLRRLYARYGIRESDGEQSAEPTRELAGAR
ncbi:MMPL family transporter [Blastococcus sp. CT_GayMR16]|uniref:MMPL family transporter n=1 Tax=Blastococcus sp. CT_GayMR16 TaxID=2559607 RepID=UPI001073B831|nr:MMPL family transporter [Blastococcus sp. CT_GayMR16]TFV87377.1 MMPL family transporter [Blastococcus sp. CT_GayMR16]